MRVALLMMHLHLQPKHSNSLQPHHHTTHTEPAQSRTWTHVDTRTQTHTDAQAALPFTAIAAIIVRPTTLLFIISRPHFEKLESKRRASRRQLHNASNASESALYSPGATSAQYTFNPDADRKNVV